MIKEKLQLQLNDLSITPIEIFKIKEIIKNVNRNDIEFIYVYREEELNKEDTILIIKDLNSLKIDNLTKKNSKQTIYQLNSIASLEYILRKIESVKLPLPEQSS